MKERPAKIELPFVAKSRDHLVKLAEIARAHGVDVLKNPVTIVECWDDGRYTLKAVVPYSFYVELALVNYGDEAELFVHFNKWM